MRQCPKCGSDTFTMGRTVKIWQTLEVRFTDELGNFDVEDDELHDTLEEGEIEEFLCRECDHRMDKTLLHAPTVKCKFCHNTTLAATAHLHQGAWVGDLCCWDERLRTTA